MSNSRSQISVTIQNSSDTTIVNKLDKYPQYVSSPPLNLKPQRTEQIDQEISAPLRMKDTT